jgi:adsorption protein B
VGCAIGRNAIGRMARETDGHPFDETSLTEDYEMGLRLRAFGGRAAFIAMPAAAITTTTAARPMRVLRRSMVISARRRYAPP